MFGVVPVEGDNPRLGLIWLLGSDDLTTFSRQFLRHSRDWLERVSGDYDLLFNYVDERNTIHVRWLQWLGFTFIGRHERFGAAGLPFLEFVRLTHV